MLYSAIMYNRSCMCYVMLWFILATPATLVTLRMQDIFADLNQTLNSINRLISFFEEGVNKLNLDAIYGLRVAEGAFKNLLSEHDTFFWQTTPETKRFHQQLLEFSKRASSVNNRAQTSIKKQGESYYNQLKDLVDKPWSFFGDFGKRKLPPLGLLHAKTRNSFRGNAKQWNEKHSDYCMSEVLGSNDKHIKCSFSKKCLNALTDGHQTGYGTTHQILVLTLAIVNHCEEKYSKILLDHAGLDVYGLIGNRCAKILDEMLEIEKRKIPEDDRDLYLEQGIVCAMHGFEEFLSLKRLRNVLSWQQQTGCFGNELDDEEEKEEGNEELNEESMDNMGYTGLLGVKKRRRRNLESYRSMRRLLVDIILENGCSAHESGVAAGLLGVYTKWQMTKLKTNI